VRGELDVETAPALEELLSREMAAKRAVVLDFAETSFMDSNGLTVLVRAINDAKVNGWNISVASTINAGW
jgi:anti-anti-sigma factor